jgi:hypothetical protein
MGLAVSWGVMSITPAIIWVFACPVDAQPSGHPKRSHQGDGDFASGWDVSTLDYAFW